MAHLDPAAPRRLVVGLDGSATAEHALRWAAEEAASRGGDVEVIAVRERDEFLPGTSYAFQPHGHRPVADEESVRAHLHDVVSHTVSPVGDVTLTETVATGDPATELIKASADADLLVVGSHRGGALSEVLLGSVAASCVRHARCPVVIVPAKLATSR
ncbi:universal stress protein [Saccharomonospora cyanea]|uniref:Universal stress protein UspA-like protein n=1 Tax=Saccharomonospora cyanea NA-134 TaxID=882082 RepID=H5XJX2_9PSEU|nr:universal stress protein [Saccharomonospora cyanea]EHR61887.1 universal stress protein UspA-like protein [Saccharomonospora cyanea NA-134]